MILFRYEPGIMSIVIQLAGGPLPKWATPSRFGADASPLGEDVSATSDGLFVP